MNEYNEWFATHKGWILLAPVLLADDNYGGLVPIPRWPILELWLEFNLMVNDSIINQVIGLFNEDAMGYLFWNIKELKKPRVIRVKKA